MSDPSLTSFDASPQLVAEESRTPDRLASTATVTVSVSDLNDNAPTFSQDAYVAQVRRVVSLCGSVAQTCVCGLRGEGTSGDWGGG